MEKYVTVQTFIISMILYGAINGLITGKLIAKISKEYAYYYALLIQSKYIENKED